MKTVLAFLFASLVLSTACGGGDEPGPDAIYPADQLHVGDDGITVKAAKLSGYCYPGIDCPTEGLGGCDWNTTPPPHIVYILHHLDGDADAGVCRYMAPEQSVPAIIGLSSYFGDNTIFGIKTGSSTHIELYGDEWYTGYHCHVPPGWGWQHGRVKADQFHDNPDGCGYEAYRYNGISSLFVHL